jgi:hypothetical protein
MKKDKKLEELLQKIVTSTGKEKQLLIAILKNKYPDAKVPK